MEYVTKILKEKIIDLESMKNEYLKIQIALQKEGQSNTKVNQMILEYQYRIDNINEAINILIASSDRSALKELIDFLTWYHSTDNHQTDETIKQIAERYLKSINIGEQGD